MLTWYMPWPSVRVRHKWEFYQNGWTNRAGYWHGSFLPDTYTILLRSLGISKNYKVIPSRALSQTPDIEHFVTACRSRCQQNSSSSSSSSSFLTNLYDNRRVVAVYYKSVICNPRTPLLRFVADLFVQLVLRLTRFLTDIGVAVGELPVVEVFRDLSINQTSMCKFYWQN